MTVDEMMTDAMIANAAMIDSGVLDSQILADEPLADERQPAAGAADLSIDSIDTYLREIGRTKLLTAAEEVELADRMVRGAAAAERMASVEELAPQARAGLSRDVARCQDARYHLIQANLRPAGSIVKKYASQGLSLTDLFQ